MVKTHRQKYMQVYNKKYIDIHKNDTKLKQQHTTAVKRYRANLRIRVFNIIGDKCAQCGISDKRCLQFDHIKGNGYKHKRKYGHFVKMLVDLLKNPDILKKELQPLCANCNWIKRYERGEVNTTYEWKLANG